MTHTGILQQLYDSEINFSLSCFWDGGIDAKLGDEVNGYRAEGMLDTVSEALDWLDEQARMHFPDSDFAKAHEATQ